jgi:hypothetical protein
MAIQKPFDRLNRAEIELIRPVDYPPPIPHKNNKGVLPGNSIAIQNALFCCRPKAASDSHYAG